MTTESAPAPTRPGVVTFIGWIILIKSAMAAVAAIFAFFGIFTDNTGLSDSQLIVVGTVEALLAILLFWAGNTLMGGNRSARTFVGVVLGLRLIATSVVVLTHHEAGYLTLSLLGAAIAVFALWALFGHDASEEYFGDA